MKNKLLKHFMENIPKKKKKSNRDAAKKVIKKKGNKLEFKWKRNGLIKNKNEPLSRIK